MAERQATLRDISQKMSRILGVNYNHDRGSKYRSKTILTELAVDICNKHRILKIGSDAEGTQILGSDQDSMSVVTGICALRSPSDIPSGSKERASYFKMEFKPERAGFCTLSVLKLHPIAILRPVGLKLSEWLTTYGSRTYLTHTGWYKYVTVSAAIFCIDPFLATGKKSASFYRRGPCVTAGVKTKDESTYNDSDMSCAIICPYWPDAALEWVSRPRLYGWPSKKLIDDLKERPCHLLPVGESESREHDLEWRFAFVYQERELMWSFSSIQIQCFVLLKALKREFLYPICPDEISSFHLKTTMFWIIENESPDMWTEENLFQCVVICLEKLKECIETMHLPHFFLTERNLLYNKMKKEEYRRKILSVLTQIQENIFQSVRKVFSLLGDPKLCEEHLGKGSSINGTNTIDRTVLDRIRFWNNQLYTVTSYLSLFIPVMIDNVSVASLEKLRQVISMKDLDEKFIRALKTFLRIRMAMKFNANAQTAKYERSKMIWLGAANEIFKDACGLDGMSGHLYYATFDLVRGEIALSKARVLALFQTDRCLYYVGRLSRKRTIIVNNANATQTDEVRYDNIKFGSDEFVALNVHFTSSDLVCLPDALKYECALLGGTNLSFCIIHPMVYSYFLLVTASQLQENFEDFDRYLDLLEGSVIDTKESFFRYTALNLLGFAYYKAGKLEKACTIFCQSLQECNASMNAAGYHLCILVQDLISPMGNKANQTNAVYSL